MNAVHPVAGIDLDSFGEPVEFSCQMRAQAFGIVRIGERPQLQENSFLRALRRSRGGGRWQGRRVVVGG